MLSKDNKDQPLATKDASFDSVLHLAVNAAAVQREGKKKKKRASRIRHLSFYIVKSSSKSDIFRRVHAHKL